MAYLDRLRELGIPERIVGGERDAWILVAAQLPGAMEMYIHSKRAQAEDPSVVEFYRDMDAVIDWEPSDPRLPALADRLVAQFEAVDETEWQAVAEDPMSDELVDLLDSMFLDQVPIAGNLMRLLEERGWTGWTQLQRIDPTPGERCGVVLEVALLDEVTLVVQEPPGDQVPGFASTRAAGQDGS